MNYFLEEDIFYKFFFHHLLYYFFKTILWIANDFEKIIAFFQNNIMDSKFLKDNFIFPKASNDVNCLSEKKRKKFLLILVYFYNNLVGRVV